MNLRNIGACWCPQAFKVRSFVLDLLGLENLEPQVWSIREWPIEMPIQLPVALTLGANCAINPDICSKNTHILSEQTEPSIALNTSDANPVSAYLLGWAWWGPSMAQQQTPGSGQGHSFIVQNPHCGTMGLRLPKGSQGFIHWWDSP